jgi:hypothetical protein
MLGEKFICLREFEELLMLILTPFKSKILLLLLLLLKLFLDGIILLRDSFLFSKFFFEINKGLN